MVSGDALGGLALWRRTQEADDATPFGAPSPLEQRTSANPFGGRIMFAKEMVKFDTTTPEDVPRLLKPGDLVREQAAVQQTLKDLIGAGYGLQGSSYATASEEPTRRPNQGRSSVGVGNRCSRYALSQSVSQPAADRKRKKRTQQSNRFRKQRGE
eukprot:GHVU01233455.1.p1 GENE.GHVU01233455.1~~GHVU01233455.1.p1  ORF type:complete len:155 (-),score=22.23 GHVU01233455.1:1377-1841(-)